MNKLILPSLICLLTMVASVNAQEQKEPPASPRQVVKQDFAFSSVEVSYSRPAMRGRTIMGELVPYDAVWRTGANAATTVTFSQDVTFGGQPVAAGKYGLLTIPGASSWTVILTSDLEVTSPDAYKQENDVVRVEATPEELPFAVESFLISFDEVLAGSMTMVLAWENTVVPVAITTAAAE